MDDTDAKFKSYLLGELCWEIEQHADLSSPLIDVEPDAIEVLACCGYDHLQVRFLGVIYDVQLSWNSTEPPKIKRANDTNSV